jgi:hypothetical protein
MENSGSPLNVNDLKRQLQNLGISTATPGLQGDDRYEELSHRLASSKKGDAKTDLAFISSIAKTESTASDPVAVPSLNNLSIGEIRSRLASLGENTNTPGITGEERRSVLMRRLIEAICGTEEDEKVSCYGAVYFVLGFPLSRSTFCSCSPEIRKLRYQYCSKSSLGHLRWKNQLLLRRWNR